MIKPFSTTGIGSLPHTVSVDACRLILESVDIPFWPQLPRLGMQELMIPQYIEGFPLALIEDENVWAIDGKQDDVFAFYSAMESDEGFPISREYAKGLYSFLDELSKRPRFPIIKGHITGPLTFTLGLTDREKRPLYFDEEKRELALALLKGKAKWQIQILKKFASDVIIFIDEPILSALGTSSYVGVAEEEAARLLRETVESIRAAGGISGIHCCSRAHWPLIVASGVDILNFDAYFYAESLRIFPDEVQSFVNNGGTIAWGVVPTTEEIRKTDLKTITSKLRQGLNILVDIGVDKQKAYNQSMITPSCGTGSLDVKDAEKVFSFLKNIKSNLQNIL